MRTYSDDQLTHAVAASQSWRGVLRSLALASTSAGAIRSVRFHADQLGLDYTHFSGVRRWTDAGLAKAVANSTTWAEVAASLGLTSSSGEARIRGHALRLGIDATHLNQCSHSPELKDVELKPKASNLARAGSLLAAAWFELCGAHVSWPMEPCRYDLLVWRFGMAERIQVKTTTLRVGSTWKAQLSSGGRQVRRTYDSSEIDKFFVITGALEYYLIPVSAVGGLIAIQVSKYSQFRVRTSAPS